MSDAEGQVAREGLDAEQEARRRLALAQIRQYPDSALRLPAKPVEEFDDDLRRLIERMTQLMHDARGAAGGARDPPPAHRSHLVLTVAATAPFGADVLERLAERHDVALLVTRPDAPRGRGRKLAPPPAKEVAERLGIPVTQPDRLDERLELPTDTMVVAAYGLLIPAPCSRARPSSPSSCWTRYCPSRTSTSSRSTASRTWRS